MTPIKRPNWVFLTILIQFILIEPIRSQPDSIREIAFELVTLNNQVQKSLSQKRALHIRLKKGSEHITISNDTLGNISFGWTNRWDINFKNDSISHASYSLSKTEDYEYFSISGFGVEFVSRDSVLVSVTKEDCYTFVDSIRWELKTYPIRVSQRGELIALIYKGSFQVLGQNIFAKENYEKILAVLAEKRYLDSEDSIYLD